MPTMARSKSLLTLLAASAFLAGCAGEATAPAAKHSAAVTSKTSPFVPTATAKALVGVADGTYHFTVDPTLDQAVNLGPNYLSIPANAICDIASSTYGVGHWNETCALQTTPVEVTAIVSDALSDHPRIDFYPAMRFSPDKNVNLYIYVPTGMDNFLKSWKMMYCADAHGCIDEALDDASLQSYADRTNMMVFRRVKHFSGYWVLGGIVDDVSSLLF